MLKILVTFVKMEAKIADWMESIDTERKSTKRDTCVSECNLLSAKDNRRIGPDGRTSVQARIYRDTHGASEPRIFSWLGRGNNFNRSKRSFDVSQGYLRILLLLSWTLAIRSRKRKRNWLPSLKRSSAALTPPFLPLLCLLSGKGHTCYGITFEFLWPFVCLLKSRNFRVLWAESTETQTLILLC